ncbi:MAG: hypothetical protein H6581_03610 [Bacteroidia bacterium]|nr:hypothetical protein [Bacteroidia bacterium]
MLLILIFCMLICGVILVLIWIKNVPHDFVGMNENAIIFKRNWPFTQDLILGSKSIKKLYQDCNTAGDVKGYSVNTGWLSYTISAADVEFLQIKKFAQTNQILFLKRFPLGEGVVEKVIFDPSNPWN